MRMDEWEVILHIHQVQLVRPSVRFCWSPEEKVGPEELHDLQLLNGFPKDSHQHTILFEVNEIPLDRNKLPISQETWY